MASPSCRPQPLAPRPPCVGQAGQNIHVHLRADTTWKKEKKGGIWGKKAKLTALCISAGLHEQRKSGRGELGSQNLPLLLVVKLLSGRKACPQNPTELLLVFGQCTSSPPLRSQSCGGCYLEQNAGLWESIAGGAVGRAGARSSPGLPRDVFCGIFMGSL